MVNFKIPLFLAFASGAVAAVFPRDNLAPRDIASPIFDEKSVIARDEVKFAEPVHELEARQISVEAQVIACIEIFVNAALNAVVAIENACGNKSAPTAVVAATVNINLGICISALRVLLITLQAIAKLNIKISISAALQVALTACIKILVRVALALYLRLNIDLAALLNLIAVNIGIWLDLWVQICVVLQLIITGVVTVLISIAASLGLTVQICIALGWQKLLGCYY